MRVLFEFEKLDRLKFVSHLDLQRFMQMALRRTDLPVAYSQGFNPHPQMNFASALAVGWTSECEILDVRLSRDVDEAFARGQMAAALPPDLPLRRVRLVSDQHPKMMAQLRMADYRITLAQADAQAICAQIPAFVQADEVFGIRKTKSGEKLTDIRPWSVSLDAEQTDVGCAILARLLLTETATLKPDLLIRVLSERAGINEPPQGVLYHRTQLLGLGTDGTPHDLLTL